METYRYSKQRKAPAVAHLREAQSVNYQIEYDHNPAENHDPFKEVGFCVFGREDVRIPQDTCPCS